MKRLFAVMAVALLTGCAYKMPVIHVVAVPCPSSACLTVSKPQVGIHHPGRVGR